MSDAIRDLPGFYRRYGLCFNVDTIDLDELADTFRRLGHTPYFQNFLEDLRQARVRGLITLEKHETLTGWDFDTQDELDAWLDETIAMLAR